MPLIKLPLLVDDLINWYIWKAKIRECNKEYHETFICHNGIISSEVINRYGFMVGSNRKYFFLNSRILENKYSYSYIYAPIKKFLGNFDRNYRVMLPNNYQYTLHPI